MYLVYFLYGYMYILARLLLQSQQTQVNTSKYEVSVKHTTVIIGYSIVVIPYWYI